LSKARHLIVDGQILQTTAWHRGMGKYTLQLLHEIDLLLSKDMQISIIFNDAIECDPKRFEVIKYLCPNVRQFNITLPLAKNKPALSARYQANLSSFVSDTFSAFDNHYLITSLFTFDFYALFPSNTRQLLILYDLIPLHFWKELGGYFPPNLYMKRFAQIYEAEQIFTISETVRQDVLKTFGIEPGRVINIDGGFTKTSVEAQKPRSFEVPDRYILFPTGDLPHKNNEIAIRGFAKYNATTDHKHGLLITSSFNKDSKSRLAKLSGEVIFTGNVTDEELHWLYLNAAAVIFASKYEGLGIPILDAVANNKPVITSRIPVFEEMTGSAYYYFDPTNEESLAKAIEEALGARGFESKQKGYDSILAKYTWERTGLRFVEALNRLGQATNSKASGKSIRSKVAIVCPHPGMNNSIGRLAESLHHGLSKKFEVDYFFDPNGLSIQQMERPTFLDYLDTPTFDISSLSRQRYRSYKAVAYLIDRGALGMRISQYAYVLPGLIFYNIDDRLSWEFNVVKTAILGGKPNSYPLKPQEKEAVLGEEIGGRIEEYIEHHRGKNISQVERLMRSRLSDRSIMKRLTKKVKDD
jgi:glycosyltransferase involved in cell wall biosynthesis